MVASVTTRNCAATRPSFHAFGSDLTVFRSCIARRVYAMSVFSFCFRFDLRSSDPFPFVGRAFPFAALYFIVFFVFRGRVLDRGCFHSSILDVVCVRRILLFCLHAFLRLALVPPFPFFSFRCPSHGFHVSYLGVVLFWLGSCREMRLCLVVDGGGCFFVIRWVSTCVGYVSTFHLDPCGVWSFGSVVQTDRGGKTNPNTSTKTTSSKVMVVEVVPHFRNVLDGCHRAFHSLLPVLYVFFFAFFSLFSWVGWVPLFSFRRTCVWRVVASDGFGWGGTSTSFHSLFCILLLTAFARGSVPIGTTDRRDRWKNRSDPVSQERGMWKKMKHNRRRDDVLRYNRRSMLGMPMPTIGAKVPSSKSTVGSKDGGPSISTNPTNPTRPQPFVILTAHPDEPSVGMQSDVSIASISSFPCFHGSSPT